MFSIRAQWALLNQKVKGDTKIEVPIPQSVGPRELALSWPPWPVPAAAGPPFALVLFVRMNVLASSFCRTVAPNLNTPVFCSPEHSQETECLREALLTSRARLQELEMELERQRGDRQQLLGDLKEKQQEILHFQEERLSLQEKDSRSAGAPDEEGGPIFRFRRRDIGKTANDPLGQAQSPSVSSALWVTLSRRSHFSGKAFFAPKMRSTALLQKAVAQQILEKQHSCASS